MIKMLSVGGCPADLFTWQQCMFCPRMDNENIECKDCSHFKFEFDSECERLNLQFKDYLKKIDREYMVSLTLY